MQGRAEVESWGRWSRAPSCGSVDLSVPKLEQELVGARRGLRRGEDGLLKNEVLPSAGVSHRFLQL